MKKILLTSFITLIFTINASAATDGEINLSNNNPKQIIESLEEGNLSLEDSIKAYEKGISLTKACQKMLSDAELKIKKLSSKEGEDVSFEDISND